MKYLSELGALKAKGSYSIAVSDGNYVYVSGQIPMDVKTGEIVSLSAGEEAKLVLNNIELILREFGCDRNNIMKTTAFMTEISYWGEINEEYNKFFTENKPARSAVTIKESGTLGFKVEIEAVAVINK